MKNSILITLILILLTSCKNEKDEKNKPVNKEFKISAKLNGFENGSKVIISDRVSGKILDSTQLLNNKFESNGSIENPPKPIGFLVQNDNGQAFSTIFIGNENIIISGDKNDFPNNIKIEGSKYHKFKNDLDQRVDSLENARTRNLNKMFSLRRENKWNDSLQEAFWSKEDGIITQIDSKIDEIKKEFITENINSDFALFTLATNKSSFGNEFIETQLNSLNSEYAKSEYANVLQTYIGSENLEIGDKYYDFEAENQLGSKVNFSDYFKDKYVLLEFYSSYCAWCKKALPEIKKLAKENKDSLRIVTFNIDGDKNDWLDDYKSDQITWTSLNKGKGRLGEVFTKYRVYATPTYFLFDKNGNLVKKWNGYKEEFPNQVNELL